MIISTSANFSAVHPKAAAGIGAYVADGAHLISLSADIPNAAAEAGAPATEVAAGVALAPAAMTAEQKQKVQKALMKFASSNFGHLRSYVPEAGPGIDVAEFIFATKYAADSIRDPNRTSIAGPLIKSARAMSELVDLIKPFVPQLKDNPYVQVAAVIIKAGDSVYQLQADLTSAIPAKPGVAAPVAH